MTRRRRVRLKREWRKLRQTVKLRTRPWTTASRLELLEATPDDLHILN